MIFLQKCREKIIILLTILILTAIFIPVIGEEVSEAIRIRAEGYAEGPSYLVRQMALGEAQKNAIEKYLLSILSEEHLKYLNPLLNKSSLYIISFKILNENTTNDKSVVELDVEINDELINKDITTLLIPYRTDLPTISMYILDLYTQDKNSNFLECINAYEVIEKKLTNLKFSVKKTNIENNYSKSDIFQLIEDGLAGKKKIAMSQDSDVFVLGVNQYEIIGDIYNTQMQKVRCNLTLELFRVSDGKLLDAFTVSASVQGKNSSDAQKQSAEDCALKSIQKIITCSFLSTLNCPKNIKDVFLYFDNFNDKNLIKKIIDYLEVVTYGGKTELIFETPKRTKYLLMFDGPIVHIVDSIYNNNQLKNKIIIKKVVDRDIYLINSNSN
ncbi:MAG: hypothetical protein ACP5UA_09305 [Candidatus Hydrogenedens sp.]